MSRIHPDGLELRAYDRALSAGESNRQIRGRAIVFNTPSRELPLFAGETFIEIIRPEAVDRSLRNGDEVIANFNHDINKLLGNSRSGTLRMTKTLSGLDVVIDPPDPTDPANLLQLIQRGDVHGMSFRFRVPDGGDEWDSRSTPRVRVVKDMTFSDVSVVVGAAYEETDVSVAVRSFNLAKEQFVEHPEVAKRRAMIVIPHPWVKPA